MSTSDKVTYGKTPIGQAVYDLCFTDLSDRYLARKHKMPISQLRVLRQRVREALSGRRPRKRRQT